jgi:ESCRT-II complex subunit VPS36
MEVAREENITMGLSTEMIAAVEADGEICRDDSGSSVVGGGAELRWWVNIFAGYVWDGQD